VKFALIKAENANFPVEFRCSELGVSRSGFYAWRGRGPSARALEDQKLAVEVAAAHRSSKDL
jgi:putative transposase